MSVAPSNEYDIIYTVAEMDGATMILLGEYHNSVLSQRLLRRVLNSVEPVAVAIELCPERYTGRDAKRRPAGPPKQRFGSRSVRTVEEHAYSEDLPVYLIDERVSQLPVDERHISALYHSYNPPEPNKHGDIDITAIRRFRASLAEERAEYFDAVLNRRERVMAGYLRVVAKRHEDGSILAVVGAAHVESVAKKIRTVRPRELSNDRISYPRGAPTRKRN